MIALGTKRDRTPPSGRYSIANSVSVGSGGRWPAPPNAGRASRGPPQVRVGSVSGRSAWVRDALKSGIQLEVLGGSWLARKSTPSMELPTSVAGADKSGTAK